MSQGGKATQLWLSSLAKFKSNAIRAKCMEPGNSGSMNQDKLDVIKQEMAKREH